MFSTWLGIVLLFLVFGLFVWVVIGASPRGDTYEVKRARVREEKLKTLHEEESKALTSYGWVDKAKGVAHVPIERAMELTMADLAKKKPAPAGPIATPQPAVAPAPAASPAPAGVSVPPQPSGSATPKPISQEGPNSMIRGQPTSTYNPVPAPPGTQPGPSATPAASPGAPSQQAPRSPAPTPTTTPPASPLPVRGKSPSP